MGREQIHGNILFDTAEEDPLIPVRCPAGTWLILDMHNFALRLFNKASGGTLVTDKYRRLTDCIKGFGNQKWDAEHNLKKIATIMSLHRSFAAWTRLPIGYILPLNSNIILL